MAPYKLDMLGDWNLTFGSNVAFAFDTAGHFLPVGSLHTHRVRFISAPPDPTPAPQPPNLPSASVDRYWGQYLPGGASHHPNSEWVGAITAETFYLGRGVMVVQLMDRADKYLAVLSGHQQYYSAEPARVEVVGGWADVGNSIPPQNTSSSRGTFVMVKI
jgi:hypothetical protein